MNPYLKRIRWRLLWISFACLTLALGSYALNQWVFAQSDDQCSWVVEKGRVVIREILPDGVAEEAGLLEGDELVKIQGRAYEPTVEGTLKAQRYINGKPEGTILIYTVKRQGRQILIPIRLVKPLDLVQLALLANGILAWAISLLVVLSAPERKSSRHFFYLAATALLLSLIVAAILCLDLLAWALLQARFGSSLLFRRQVFIFMLPAPLLPLTFAYAIFRHGLFDVRVVLLRWVSYMAVLGLTLAAYLGGLAWAFSHLVAIPSGWAGALIGLLALPLGWALRRLVRTIRRRFRRDFASTREVALSIVREPRKRFSEESLLKSVRRSLDEAFQPHSLDILPVQDHLVLLPAAEATDREERRLHFPAQPLRLPAGLLRLARENQELVLGLGSEEADWVREQGGTLRAHMDALEAQLLLLILAGDAPHSVVLLGGKYAQLSYSREDRDLLREVAQAAGGSLETAVMHQRLVAQERLSQELETARRIQEGLVTSQVPPIPGFQVALRLEPALETGGDLLFVKRRPSGNWLAAVGDVCGKGLAAALYMAQATALLEQAAQSEDQGLAEILASLDQTLRHLLGQRGFLTLILLEWDAAGNYRLARAGHPGALFLQHPGEDGTTELTPGGRGLGLRPAGPGDWKVTEGTLPPKGWLVLYSDGLSEAMNRDGELYGLPRLCTQLRRLWGTGSPRAACEAIFQDVSAFDTRNPDDRTLFILGREA